MRLGAIDDVGNDLRSARRFNVGIGCSHRHPEDGFGPVRSGEGLPHVRFVRVDHMRGAKLRSDRETSRGEIDHRDVGKTTVERRGKRAEADRASTKDRKFVSGIDVGLFDTVHSNTERLGKRRNVERQRIGNAKDPSTHGGVAD